jgi:hypothetical protein
MEDLKKLNTEINDLFDAFKMEAAKGIERDTKAARRRARSISVTIEEKLKQFRKKSVELDRS